MGRRFLLSEILTLGTKPVFSQLQFLYNRSNWFPWTVIGRPIATNVRIEEFRIEPCADVIVSTAARRSIFSKIPEQISFYPQNFLNFLMTFFSRRKLQQNKSTATMASAARRQIIGGGVPINKSRQRRRTQIVGGARL